MSRLTIGHYAIRGYTCVAPAASHAPRAHNAPRLAEAVDQVREAYNPSFTVTTLREFACTAAQPRALC
jgi:hypothetical protein